MRSLAVDSTQALLGALSGKAASRQELWAEFLEAVEAQVIAEIGVWKGDFAAHLLSRCSSIARYYMVDPWRHLDSWNKPANVDERTFEAIYQQALEKTEFVRDKRTVLRGRTTEVIEKIAESSLDFVYIDGDHTLKGITADLVRCFPKVRPGGFIGGDDFTQSVWQHSAEFEPTLVFPFTVYFAEAVQCPIFALPYSQFLIIKVPETHRGFVFHDLTGKYPDLALRAQVAPILTWRQRLSRVTPTKVRRWLRRISRERN